MNTAIRTLRTMIIALAMIGMLSGIGAATIIGHSYMDYRVDFDGMGTGSIGIFTQTPIGSDGQMVDWSNCEADGWQTGNYGDNGLMTIVRDTRIDTARANDTGTMNHNPVSGDIVTWSQMNAGDGVAPGTVLTYVTLNDSYIGNPPEDYIELDQTTKLYDSDMKVGDTRVGYESIYAYTDITGRIFDNSGNGYDMLAAGVVTTSDGLGNVSSAVGGMLSEGEMFMGVDSRLIDNTTNVESSRTDFTIDVPNMSGYSERNTGAFGGYGAINGGTINSMNTVFENVDNVNTTGYFYEIK